MNISTKKFNSFVDEYSKVKKFVTEGNVVIREDWSKRNYNKPNNNEDEVYSIHYENLKFKNLSNAHKFTQVSRINGNPKILTVENKKDPNSPEVKIKESIAGNLSAGSLLMVTTATAQNLAKDYKSMRFIPKTDLDNKLKFPKIISKPPYEIMEGNNTYRVLCRSGYGIYFIGCDTDDIYDYLDEGFFILGITGVTPSGKKNRHMVVTNQLDINTMHIFILCQFQPKFCEMLHKGCFVHTNDAQMMRLKMEKKLPEKYKTKYEHAREAIEKDYQNNTSLILINNLNNKEIAKVALNDIELTSNSASYDRIKIEADDLLNVIYSKVNFGGEFDIYSVVETYADHIQEKVDGAQLPEEGQFRTLPTIKINGFNINITTSHTGVRRINGKRINKAEIKDAVYRASCHHTQEDYDLFLNRISRMSLLWHDILANGLPVKIHDNMTWDEYREPEPSAAAPAIKFFIDKEDRCIKIKTEDPKGCRVRLGQLIKKIDTINRKTNNRWTRGGMESRNSRWARKELAKALKEATTFDVKTKREDGTVETRSVTGITAADITKLIQIADEYKKAAIERSKNFLATAVQFTGAKEIEFMGKQAYKVDGTLRSYAVVIETAKVYDYQTKQYRCIVNDNHFRGAGYDDIAARLYALKNDSVMQKVIGTLKGAAQPGAENAHNDYVPDRAVDDAVLEGLNLD
jgi:hypothetical protein